MSPIKQAKPSPALLIAVVALVAALAGTAVGGVTVSALKKGEKQQVKKIAKRVSKKQARKLDKRIELLPGPQGAQGPQGSPGVSGLVRVRTPSDLQGSESVKFAMAICPGGKRVIGAGADIRAGVEGDPPDQTTNMVINEIIPSEETVVPGTVTVRAYENEPTADEWGVTAFALCANVS